MRLKQSDLDKVEKELPVVIKDILINHNVFLAGGSVVSMVKGIEAKDWDFFGPKSEYLESMVQSYHSKFAGSRLFKTKNAITLYLPGVKDIQVITRWLFNSPKAVADSFDFAICRAVVFYDKETGKFDSVIDRDFYYDLDMNQITYKRPDRDEDSAGSLLRAFKYAQKGYKVPRKTVTDVVARFIVDAYGEVPIDTEESLVSDHLFEKITNQFSIDRGNY